MEWGLISNIFIAGPAKLLYLAVLWIAWPGTALEVQILLQDYTTFIEGGGEVS